MVEWFGKCPLLLFFVADKAIGVHEQLLVRPGVCACGGLPTTFYPLRPADHCPCDYDLPHCLFYSWIGHKLLQALPMDNPYYHCTCCVTVASSSFICAGAKDRRQHSIKSRVWYYTTTKNTTSKRQSTLGGTQQTADLHLGSHPTAPG